MRRALGLNRLSRFEDAMDAGERFVSELGLGPVPALRLAAAMEEELRILVLMVDALEGISGAACRLPELDAVLIARREVAGRHNLDLAHELFHILTWDAMPPEHVESASDFGGNRVEQLANNFAAAVLMPAKSGRSGRLRPGRRADLDRLAGGVPMPSSHTETSEAVELPRRCGQADPYAARSHGGGACACGQEQSRGSPTRAVICSRSGAD